MKALRIPSLTEKGEISTHNTLFNDAGPVKTTEVHIHAADADLLYTSNEEERKYANAKLQARLAGKHQTNYAANGEAEAVDSDGANMLNDFTQKEHKMVGDLLQQSMNVDQMRGEEEDDKERAKAKLQARLAGKPKGTNASISNDVDGGEDLMPDDNIDERNSDIMNGIMHDASAAEMIYGKESADKERAKAKLQNRLAANKSKPSGCDDTSAAEEAKATPSSPLLTTEDVLRNIASESIEIQALRDREDHDKALAKAKLDARLKR